MSRGLLWAACTLASFALAACDNNACPTGGTGTLIINTTGLPDGTPAEINFSGMDSELTGASGASIEHFSAGPWTASAKPVASSGGLVRRAFEFVGPSEFCMDQGGTTAVTFEFKEIPTSGKLWMSAQNASGVVLGFGADTIGASTNRAADVSVKVRPEIPAGRGIAFDQLGNLWAADGSGSVKRIPAAALTVRDFVEADIVITSPSFGNGLPGPQHLAFDSLGGLWVSVSAAKKIVRFNPEQLTASGSPTAVVEISTGASAPGALAFSKDGSLWAAVGESVAEYRNLGESHSSPPARYFKAMRDDGSNASLGAFSGLAFDGSGNMLATFFTSNVIARITPLEIPTLPPFEVAPKDQVQVGVTALLTGIALDEQGGIWTALSNGSFGRFSSSQLSATGTVAPEAVISSDDLGAVNGIAVFPAPAGLPLYHSLP